MTPTLRRATTDGQRRKCSVCSKNMEPGTPAFVREFTVERHQFQTPGMGRYARTQYAHLACGEQYPRILGIATAVELPQ